MVRCSVSIIRQWLLSIIALCVGIQTASAEFVADGVNLVPLTNDGRSIAVAWAWHGNWIALVRQNPGSNLSQLVIVKTDGSNETSVCPVGSPMFAEWSWRGDKIAYEFTNAHDSESQGGVFVYDTATGKTSSRSTT